MNSTGQPKPQDNPPKSFFINTFTDRVDFLVDRYIEFLSEDSFAVKEKIISEPTAPLNFYSTVIKGCRTRHGIVRPPNHRGSRDDLQIFS